MGFTKVDKDGIDKTLKDLNLTNEETEKFAKAFKDPEFIRLFEEYAKEVSDPKVKAETDMYLRQLEMEGRVEEVYGKGAQLILPTPEFVIKSKNTQDGSKIFINMCTSDKVGKASLKSAVSANGSKGQNFDMPLCLGPKKTGTDKAGSPASIWDFVVHPETISMADATPAIKKVMIETAIENIERNNLGIKLCQEYKLPKMTYKGTEACPTPHALALRGEGGTSVNGHVKPAPPAHPAAGGAGERPTATSSSTSDPEGSGKRSSFSFGAAAKIKEAVPTVLKEPTQAGFVHPGGEVTPSWEVAHRGLIDLSDSWGDAGRGMVINTTHPKELVIYVTLPGVSSVSGVQLDVSRNDVSVLVPGTFLLAAPLPFAVDSDKGRAKFDKAKGRLEVVLPVIPPPLPSPAPSFQPGALVEEVPAETGGCLADDSNEASAGVEQQAVGSSSGSARDAPCTDKDGLAGIPTYDLEAKTVNQKKWEELHESQKQAMVSQAKGEAAPDALQPVSSDTPLKGAPPQQPIKLKPRLKSNIAGELD